MFDIDPMVNEKIMRERREELVRRVQLEDVVRDSNNTNGNHKALLPLRAVLVGIINLIMR